MSLLRSLYVQGVQTRTPRHSEHTSKGRNFGKLASRTDRQRDRQRDRTTPFIHRLLALLRSSSAYNEALCD
eukprot:11374472-Ditylum_brightwellii.AAC.1